MKIGVAQIKPLKGDIEKNLDKHLKFIESISEKKPDLLLFPELSLTGYEPELARDLATKPYDERFIPIQKLSDHLKIIIGVGVPTLSSGELFISMILFIPNRERITYSKQYLYPTETGIFTAGKTPCIISFDDEYIIAPAICYELSNNEHAGYAHRMNANVYIASVLNSIGGVDADIERLSKIASTYKMITFMSNYVGESGGYQCAGKSSVWNTEGELVAQLDGQMEGVLIYDTKAKTVDIIEMRNRSMKIG